MPSLTKCDLQERVQRNAREVAGCDSGNLFALIFADFLVIARIFANLDFLIWRLVIYDSDLQ